MGFLVLTVFKCKEHVFYPVLISKDITFERMSKDKPDICLLIIDKEMHLQCMKQSGYKKACILFLF